MKSRLAVLAVVSLLVGCGASGADKTADLREMLRQDHQYDSGYELLGAVTVDDDGDVTVRAEPWANPLAGAELYCGWVSGWAYDHGTADTRVTVTVPPRAGGEEVTLVRRGASESCSEATA